MSRILSAGPALLLVGLLLAGCQSMGEKKKQDALTLALRAYESTLRWGEIPQAYGYLKPDKAKDIQIPAGLENIRLTSYEVIKPPLPVGDDAIAQTVVIHFIEQDRQMEKKLVDNQIWEYDADAGRWYLISGVPEFVTAKVRVLPLGK